MNKYQILKWDRVIDCAGIERPIIYFKPDMDMVIKMQDNNDKLYLNITGTKYYDGNMIYSEMDISNMLPNECPGFGESCRIFTSILKNVEWRGIDNGGEFILNLNPIIPTCWRK